MSDTFYKYRSFDNFEHLVDIIVNSRIYAANYNSMNDPMEGCYEYPNDYDDEAIKLLEKELDNTKFCSLSRHSNIDLMWAHYANGNRGLCIGIEVKRNRKFDEYLPIIYDGQPKLIEKKDFNSDRAKKILRHKSECWHYEQEVRVFPTSGHLIDVTVKEVIFGKRANSQLEPLVSQLLKQFQPNAVISKQK